LRSDRPTGGPSRRATRCPGAIDIGADIGTPVDVQRQDRQAGDQSLQKTGNSGVYRKSQKPDALQRFVQLGMNAHDHEAADEERRADDRW
jgi:hypothetical protein